MYLLLSEQLIGFVDVSNQRGLNSLVLSEVMQKYNCIFSLSLGFVEVYDLKTKTWTRGHKNYPEDTWEHACVALHIPSIRKDEIESE